MQIFPRFQCLDADDGHDGLKKYFSQRLFRKTNPNIDTGGVGVFSKVAARVVIHFTDTCRTFPKRIGKLKTHKNHKDTSRTLKNWVILRKILRYTRPQQNSSNSQKSKKMHWFCTRKIAKPHLENDKIVYKITNLIENQWKTWKSHETSNEFCKIHVERSQNESENRKHVKTTKT